MPSQQKACLDNQKAGNRRQSRSSHVHVRAKKKSRYKYTEVEISALFHHIKYKQ